MPDDLMNTILDNHCLTEIFSYLNPLDIVHVQKVCQRWNELCQRSWRTVVNLHCKDSTQNEWYVKRSQDHHEYNLPHVNDALKIIKEACPFIVNCHLVGKFQIPGFQYFTGNMLKVNQSGNIKKFLITILPLPEMSINTLLDDCINIEKLTLENFNRDLEEDVQIFLTKNKQLKSFSLKYNSIQDASSHITSGIFEYLPANVEEIHISRAHVEPSNLIAILEKKCLKSFGYDTPYRFQDSLAEIIGNKNTLIRLSMKNSCESPASFDHFAKLVNLEELNLSDNNILQDDNLINISNGCKHLKSLDISDCTLITSRGMAAIANLTKLEHLKMNRLWKVTDDFIDNVPCTLKSLSCIMCSGLWNHGVIKLINKADNLTSLNLKDGEITYELIDAAIRKIETRKSRNALEIYVNAPYVNKLGLEEVYGDDFEELPPLLKIIFDDDDNYCGSTDSSQGNHDCGAVDDCGEYENYNPSLDFDNDIDFFYRYGED